MCARASPVPGSEDALRVDSDETFFKVDLERVECIEHVGLLQYIANDRFELKYALQEVRRNAARPTC